MLRSFLAQPVTIVLALLFYGCDGAQVSNIAVRPFSNQEFRVGIPEEPAMLHRLLSSSGTTTFVVQLTNQAALVTMDAHSKWVPMLAEKIPTLENKMARFVTVQGKPGMEVDFVINKNAVWGDGTPVTGKDFQLSLSILQSPNCSAADSELGRKIHEIRMDPKQPKKITIVYNDRFFGFAQIGTFAAVPSHIEGPLFEKYRNEREGYDRNTLYVKDPTNPGLSSGPYRLVEAKPGSHLILDQNPRWWGKKPKINRIVFRVFGNTSAIESALITREIDAGLSSALPTDQGIAFEDRIAKEKLPYKVLMNPGLVYNHLTLNLMNKHLANRNVRQALSLAVPKDLISKTFYKGRAQSAFSFIHPIDPWFSESENKKISYALDLEQAKELLKTEGYLPGPGGILTKGGEKFSIEVVTSAGLKINENILLIIKDHFKKIGVELALRTVPPRVLFAEVLTKREFSGIAFFAWSSSPENTPLTLFSKANIPTKENGFSGQNFGAYTNPEFETLAQSIESEFNPKKRKDKANQLAAILARDLPMIPIVFRPQVAVIPSSLKGFIQVSHQFSESNQVADWDLE